MIYTFKALAPAAKIGYVLLVPLLWASAGAADLCGATTLPGLFATTESSRPGMLVAARQSAKPSGPRTERRRQNTARTDMPFGISAVNHVDEQRTGKPFDTSDPNLNVYANPNTSGITFRTSWADIEPEEGKFDFNKIDAVFDNAEKNGKWVELILIPGFGTPAWALRGVENQTFTIAYGKGEGDVLPLPVPWNRTYLSRWSTFLKAVADRYGSKPSFRKIAAAGPTSVSAEMSLPDSANDLAQWKKLGYTPQKYVNAWKETFAVYASTFPNQYFSLALHPGLPIPDERQRDAVREEIIKLGLQYPNRFALQADGLNSNEAKERPGYHVVREHSGQVATGFMMSTSATRKSERMGASGDPANNLRASINTALAPNSRGAMINYLEIYEPDIINPSMQQALHEGQQRLIRGAGR